MGIFFDGNILPGRMDSICLYFSYYTCTGKFVQLKNKTSQGLSLTETRIRGGQIMAADPSSDVSAAVISPEDI